MVKNLPANTGDSGSIPGFGRSPRGGHGNPLQYACLENMDRRAWRLQSWGRRVGCNWTHVHPPSCFFQIKVSWSFGFSAEVTFLELLRVHPSHDSVLSSSYRSLTLWTPAFCGHLFIALSWNNILSFCHSCFSVLNIYMLIPTFLLLNIAQHFG